MPNKTGRNHFRGNLRKFVVVDGVNQAPWRGHTLALLHVVLLLFRLQPSRLISFVLKKLHAQRTDLPVVLIDEHSRQM